MSISTLNSHYGTQAYANAAGRGRKKHNTPTTKEKNNSEVHDVVDNGDSVFVSQKAKDALMKQKSENSDYLGSINDHKIISVDEYIEFLCENPNPELVEADKLAALKVNWNAPSNITRSYFTPSKSGGGLFENGLSQAIALRGMDWEIAPGKSARLEEYHIMDYASSSRNKAYEQLQSAMKQSGIELKPGQKLDFIMDENGKIAIDPKSNNDKEVAAKVEALFNDNYGLNTSIRDFLHISEIGVSSDPATMRANVDSLLREYTGMGFDDLEWDSSGNLIAPDGYDKAVEKYRDLGPTLGQLKNLLESEGEAIFKKEFSFTVTASGITCDKLSNRAGSNIFNDKKMFDQKIVYNDQILSINGKPTNLLGADLKLDHWKGDLSNLDALQAMIQKVGTSVYIASNSDNSFAIDKNGNRQSLPYCSDSHTATARYLIEDYLIDNGIKGNVSDYAVKMDKKGSYEVVRLSK